MREESRVKTMASEVDTEEKIMNGGDVKRPCMERISEGMMRKGEMV
jgi:hypothetical protein